MNTDIMALTALQAGQSIKNKEFTAVEAVQASLDAIRRSEGRIHAFITVDEERALKRAAQVQREIGAGKLDSPLAGIPVAIKDNICTEGLRTTCASRMLENYIPTYTAEAVRRLENAGAIVVGKTNMDEFAMGSTTETSAFGVTRNPHNPEHVPGGSSGGSCAAVAAGEVLCALGSDTGGSIRQPGAFCGVTGLKPTYGTVSRYGLIAYGSSLDQIGPIAKDVRDCAAILDVISGRDPKDSTSVDRRDSFFQSKIFSQKENKKRLRVGIPADYLGEGLAPEIRAAVFAAAEALKEQGAGIETFTLGLASYALPAYYVIACAEASSNLERFDGVKYGHRAADCKNLEELYRRSRSEGFGREVRRRIMLGSFVLSSGYYEAFYLKALKAKTLIKKAFDDAFLRYDVIITPTAPSTAPKIGTSLSDPMQMYLGDIYTVSANLAGLPGISIPWGVDTCGLPIGVQLLADCFGESNLLRAAYACECAKDNHI